MRHIAALVLLRRRIRQLWRRIFQPHAVRIPGKWPWVQPSVLPFGSILIPGDPAVIADGKGGITINGQSLLKLSPEERRRLRNLMIGPDRSGRNARINWGADHRTKGFPNGY